jgi:hypothetical protein
MSSLCRDCGREWTGMAECHCPAEGCHRHFTGLSAFDAHFAKDGSHQDPPLVWPESSKRAGQPAFEQKQRASGLVWGAVSNESGDARFASLSTAATAETGV